MIRRLFVATVLVGLAGCDNEAKPLSPELVPFVGVWEATSVGGTSFCQDGHDSPLKTFDQIPPLVVYPADDGSGVLSVFLDGTCGFDADMENDGVIGDGFADCGSPFAGVIEQTFFLKVDGDDAEYTWEPAFKSGGGWCNAEVFVKATRRKAIADED